MTNKVPWSSLKTLGGTILGRDLTPSMKSSALSTDDRFVDDNERRDGQEIYVRVSPDNRGFRGRSSPPAQ